MDGCEEFADKCPRLTRHEVEKCLWEEGEAKDFESFFFFFLNLKHVGIVLVCCVSLRINVIFIGNCSRNN